MLINKDIVLTLRRSLLAEACMRRASGQFFIYEKAV